MLDRAYYQIRLRKFVEPVVTWFLTPGSPRTAACFRMAVAAFGIVKLATLRGSILDLYGQYGFVQWAITRANLYSGLPHIGDIALWLRPLGISADQTVSIVLALHIAALVGMLIGLYSRSMACLAWATHFVMLYAAGGLLYGMDMFNHIALFYCVIMPTGSVFSLDSKMSGSAAMSLSSGVTLRMLQIHMCIIYASAGLEKSTGLQWWNGEAIWRSVNLPVFRQFDFTWLARVPWVAMVIGWSVIATELGYVFFIWPARTRPVWLAMTLGMHAAIGLCLGMWFFAFIMIILNVTAFGGESVSLLYRWIRTRAVPCEVGRFSMPRIN